jgi:hypothetical protein
MPSTAVPPASEPSSTQSRAIQEGADLLLELFNREQSQLTLVYRENEKRFKAQAEARIASADFQLANNKVLLGKLSSQYDGSVRDLEVTRNELQHVKAEHAKLMASIEHVGLVYMDGTLHFDDTTAKIVSDFRESAQILDMVVSHVNPNLGVALLPPDQNTEACSKEIKPSDFFVFLSRVLHRQYPHVLKMQPPSRNASSLEGNLTSMTDAMLDDSESQKDSFVVWPGTY